MAHGPLHGAEVDAGFEPMGGIGMAERMDPDVSFEDASPLGGFAESALDAAAAHGRGGGSPVFLIASACGKEPGGVAMGFPGQAQECQGLMRERDIAVLGALAAVDVDHVARAIDIAHLQGKRFVQAQPTAVDGGEGDAIVEGSGSVEETVHLFQAADSRESVFGRCANEVEGLPVAFKDVVVEESASTVADAHGAWSEAVDILAV
jgi:hypothetical protein